MRAFWFDAKQPLSMQHSHLSFASETELCIDQPCIAKDASAMHDTVHIDSIRQPYYYIDLLHIILLLHTTTTTALTLLS